MQSIQLKIMRGVQVMSVIGIADPEQAASLYWGICKKLRDVGSDLTVETNKRDVCENI